MEDQFELHLERTVDTQFEHVESVLRSGPQHWLPEFQREGDTQTAELAFSQSGTHVVRRIAVDTGPVQRFAYGVTVHVRWKAASHSELYPDLDGHLRAEPGRPSGSKIRFDARYVPPAGRLGATVDRAVMHRVAEASVEDFLDRVVKLLAAR